MSDLGSNRLAVLAAEIRAGHQGVENATAVRAKHALDTGRALIEAKALLKHGQWLPWLKENCGIPDRTVRLYMQLAEVELPAEAMVQMIATLGMTRAATTVTVMHEPHPLDRYPEPLQREWALFSMLLGGFDPDQLGWYMRHGPVSDTPDAVLTGRWATHRTAHRNALRHRSGHGNSMLDDPSPAFLAAWAEVKLKYADVPIEQIDKLKIKPVPWA